MLTIPKQGSNCPILGNLVFCDIVIVNQNPLVWQGDFNLCGYLFLAL
ncbi:hypothetical protein [Moraxella lacunata]